MTAPDDRARDDRARDDRARDEQPAEAEIPGLWRDRCGMPLLADFPIRCKRPLAHDEGHVGWRGKEQIRWPGQGSPVPLCWGATYRCWHENNRPDSLAADMAADADVYDAQPAPAGDDELREAERYVQGLAQHSPAVGRVLDERGRELERLRAQTRDLDGRLLDACVRYDELRVGHRAELERLRARDEKAAAVVQLWRSGPTRTGRNGDPLWRALDELARAHGETER